jgi:general secretion pathway protein I
MSRSTGDQDAALNSAACGLRTCCGSQTRAPGFSLIEVIVAVAILSIALVGLAHGISTALGSSKEAEWQTTASMYAAGVIENLRAEGGIIDGQTEGDCGAELPMYRWTESITPAGVDGLHQVDVSILNSHSGREIYALRTLLFEVPADSTDSKSKNSKSKKKSSAKS